MQASRNLYGKLESRVGADNENPKAHSFTSELVYTDHHEIKWNQLMDQVRSLETLDSTKELNTVNKGTMIRQGSCPDLFSAKEVRQLSPDIWSLQSCGDSPSCHIGIKGRMNLPRSSASSPSGTFDKVSLTGRTIRTECSTQSLRNLNNDRSGSAPRESTADPSSTKAIKYTSKAGQAASPRSVGQSASCTAGVARALTAALRSALPARRASARAAATAQGAAPPRRSSWS